MSPDRPLHILLLTDRDWTHPQGGGTGTNLYGQVTRWLAWGHRVTVIAGDYPGAEKLERPAPNLEIHRMGNRLTVFPRAALAVRRGVGADADVVLEVINGIAFFTPLWWFLKRPRVALVHHVHQDHYVAELGRRGRIAAFLAEYLPLRFLYKGTQVLTISQSAHDDLVQRIGIDPKLIHVAYLGVEPDQFHEGRRAEEPTLLYLGRLKQYKRIEVALDVLEGVPGARLEIAGTGDWREVIEREIEQRGLQDRVTMHGFVPEEMKPELYGRAWLNLTASSAEGWCLTVMEAAACGTPSAALRVGGLAESVVDGETGVLADTPEELTEKVRELVADPRRRDEMGAAAKARARGFTWENTARANLEVLRRAAQEPRVSLRRGLRDSETLKAGGLAAATLMSNGIQLIFTIVFTRLLGADGYGSLAALVSTFLILMVGGQAIQVAAARETALHHLGDGRRLAATLNGWVRQLLIALVVVTALSLLFQDALAGLVGVRDHPLAAAAILPTGVLWLLLSLQRGALQGMHAYGPVGLSLVMEAFGRLLCGLVLVLAGAEVTGAFLGTPLAFALTAVWMGWVIHKRLGSAEDARTARTLRSLLAGAWAPIGGLALLALLQNVDVIVVKRQIGGDTAGSYAAAAVAAKAVVWVAVGIALHLLPEATRRAAAGLDPLPVLRRSFAVLAVIATPALLIFALAAEPLMRLAFGADLTQASDALPVLGLAMTLLAVAYLTVQYMLALGRTSFLWVLGVVAVIEPILLSLNTYGVVEYAAIVLGLQCAAALGVLVLGLRARSAFAPASVR
ncbi:MAG: glycosyltransferase [Solirubrobacteraceae bacterium]|nr:glycosyltransferase [Solirubrobacteraceae bacterium]